MTRAYDSLGRLTGYTGADGTGTTTRYDILDWPISVDNDQVRGRQARHRSNARGSPGRAIKTERRQAEERARL
jgi:YD repeat-containing protein